MFFKKIIKIIQKTEFSLFLITIILFRIPPFFLMPLTKNPLLTSHSLGRYFVVWLFFSNILFIFIGYKRLLFSKNLGLLTLFFFVTQSFSIVKAINTEAFLLQYKNFVFGFVIFITALLIINSKRKLLLVLNTLLLTIFFNVVFQTIIYFQPEFLIKIVQRFLYESYWDVLNLNLKRERFFVDIYDAALLPLIIALSLKTQRRSARLIYVLLMISVAFFAFVSNFRTQLIMTIFSLLSSLILLLNKNRVIFTVLFLFVFYIGIIISIKIVGYNTLSRVLLQEAEDIQTITGRFEHWRRSLDMVNSSPYVGVGLGNYYDNLNSKTTFTTSIFNWKNTLGRITATHPHSVFFGTVSETGYLGLFSYILLLLYFLITDYKNILKKNKSAIPSIISFWSLSIYAAFNPPVTLPYFFIFWLLRVFIIKTSIINCK